MGKIIKEQILSDEWKQERGEAIILRANDILNKRGVHNQLGLEQQEVANLRKLKPNLKGALYVLFHAGELDYERISGKKE